MTLTGSAQAGDITAVIQGSTLVITGGSAIENVGVFFNRRSNGSLWVRVSNSTGRVNANGSTGGGAQNFELAGIRTIRVSLGASRDSLSFLHADRFLKNWNGDLSLDFGDTPPTGARESLVIRGPLQLRNIVVRGNHAQRNDTIDGNVTYASFRKL
ncbi:MAG: hypothetical protein SFV81_24345 [Pirellulaceae bacterium]|nr:hypothetical protein [Pirellulaceae bacterium]